MEDITIFITPLEAERFRYFQKHHDMIEKIVSQDIFGMNFGKITLNVAHGEIQNIVKEEMTWRKG